MQFLVVELGANESVNCDWTASSGAGELGELGASWELGNVFVSGIVGIVVSTVVNCRYYLLTHRGK